MSTRRLLWERGGGEWCAPLWWRGGGAHSAGCGEGAGPGDGDGVPAPPSGLADPGYPLDISSMPPLGYTGKVA